jgi:hypothetical protein
MHASTAVLHFARNTEDSAFAVRDCGSLRDNAWAV